MPDHPFQKRLEPTPENVWPLPHENVQSVLHENSRWALHENVQSALSENARSAFPKRPIGPSQKRLGSLSPPLPGLVARPISHKSFNRFAVCQWVTPVPIPILEQLAMVNDLTAIMLPVDTINESTIGPNPPAVQRLPMLTDNPGRIMFVHPLRRDAGGIQAVQLRIQLIQQRLSALENRDRLLENYNGISVTHRELAWINGLLMAEYLGPTSNRFLAPYQVALSSR
jgi:hypothetical protein